MCQSTFIYLIMSLLLHPFYPVIISVIFGNIMSSQTIDTTTAIIIVVKNLPFPTWFKCYTISIVLALLNAMIQQSLIVSHNYYDAQNTKFSSPLLFSYLILCRNDWYFNALGFSSLLRNYCQNWHWYMWGIWILLQNISNKFSGRVTLHDSMCSRF